MKCISVTLVFISIIIEGYICIYSIYILMLKLTKLRIFNICVAPVNSIGKMSKFTDFNQNN